jgi:hypothetical protein
MTKDQMPNQKIKFFHEFEILDIIQSSNGNLFIKMGPDLGVAIGCYEWLGTLLVNYPIHEGMPIKKFEPQNHPSFIKVGSLKFKKKFLKFITENETT